MSVVRLAKFAEDDGAGLTIRELSGALTIGQVDWISKEWHHLFNDEAHCSGGHGVAYCRKAPCSTLPDDGELAAKGEAEHWE